MRPTNLEVNLPQLRKNLLAIRAHVSPAKVMPMIKANAYGHGVDGVAPCLEPDVDAFGVALVEEAIHLRSLGITKPILVAGGTLPEQIPLFLEHDLILTASSPELLSSSTKDTLGRLPRNSRIARATSGWNGAEVVKPTAMRPTSPRAVRRARLAA